ncbi:MAG: Ig-like domain-containing protein, partial [Thermoplasmata archaeon]
LGRTVTIDFTNVGSSVINVSDSGNPAVFNNTKTVTVGVGAPYRILYVSGSGQIGFVDSSLSAPFVVKVEDYDNNPVPDVVINWSLDAWPSGASGQSLSDYNSLTDANGEAATTLTLGDTAGLYYINATNTTLTLAGEPVTFNASVSMYTIDDVIITNASGVPIGDIDLTADDTLTLYAWAYNKTAGILGALAVNWTSLGGIGTFTTSNISQTQVTFDPTTAGAGSITAEFTNATLTLSNSTGVITVTPGGVVSIVVTPPFAWSNTDEQGAFSAVGYDSDNNENWNWIPQWQWEGAALGDMIPTDNYNYTVDYHTVGSDSLRVSLSTNPTIFGASAITVLGGQLARIEISPWPSVVATTDDEGAFSIVGYDADGNANWSWSHSVIWDGDSLGPMITIDPYNFTVPFNTVGTSAINVTFTGDSTIYNSTEVVVSAGQVARVEITPWPSTSALTGDTGMFSVMGYDADNNENWTWIPIWAWEGAGLGGLTPITAFNYSISYDTAGSDNVNVSVEGEPGIYNTTSVTVTLPPTVDYIVIMDAPGGTGSAVDVKQYAVGDTDTFHAAGFNTSSGYVMDIDVIWSSSDDTNATVSAGPGNSTTFTANNTHGGLVIITATNTSLPVSSNFTGTLTIMEPTVDYIQIRDAPDNGGSLVGARSYSAGETDRFYAAGFNNTGGYLGDVSVDWESTNTAAGTISPAQGTSTNFTAGTASGTTTVNAVYTAPISNSTGALTVSVIVPAPIIDRIVIMDAPGGTGNAVADKSFIAGESYTFHAVGYNSTTGDFVDDVSVVWSVDSGLGTLDMTEGYSTNFTASNLPGIDAVGTLTATYNSISGAVDITVDLAPSVPLGLQVSQRREGSSLTITWSQNPEPDVQGYVIYRSIESQANFVQIATAQGGDNTSYTDTGLTDGTTYYYYIQAFDSGPNYSPASGEANKMSDTDTDGDNNYDAVDIDDDNDGLSDSEEAELGTNSKLVDTDGDGHNDFEDKFPLDPDKWKEEEEAFPIALLIVPIIIIIVVVLLLLMLMKKRKPEEEMPAEELEEVSEEDMEFVEEEEPWEEGGEEEEEESWEEEEGEEEPGEGEGPWEEEGEEEEEESWEEEEGEEEPGEEEVSWEEAEGEGEPGEEEEVSWEEAEEEEEPGEEEEVSWEEAEEEGEPGEEEVSWEEAEEEGEPGEEEEADEEKEEDGMDELDKLRSEFDE